MTTFANKEFDTHGIGQDYNCETITELSDNNHDEDKNDKNMNQGSLEPFIGMEFQSLEEALDFYTKYAKHERFEIRKSRIIKSRTTQLIIGQEFVCSNEGYQAKKYLEREERTHAPSDET
ncbi:hypothetical protein REPUB_Repub20aG0004700 [Reevesia pubescens]